MKANNSAMESMVTACSGLLDRCDVLGYACARNYKALSDALAPFYTTRDRMVSEYGKPDDRGNMCVNASCERWDEFSVEYNKILSMESDVDIFKVKASECVGKVSGRQMLDIDWMLDWDD